MNNSFPKKISKLRKKFKPVLSPIKEHFSFKVNYNSQFSKHNNKFLKGYSKRPVKRYNKLNNAMKNALFNNSTSGITMSKKIKKYTLRKGKNLLNSPSGEISWIKKKKENKKIDKSKTKKKIKVKTKLMSDKEVIVFNSKSSNNFLLSNFYGGSETCYMKDRFNNTKIKLLFDDFETCDNDKFVYYLKELQPKKKWTEAKINYWFKEINGEKKPIRGILSKLVGNSVKGTPTGNQRLKIIKKLANIDGELDLKPNISDKQKKELMLNCLRKKFSNKIYRDELLKTGNAVIHEKPMRGNGDNWTFPGGDWLGQLLMKVREEIQ